MAGPGAKHQRLTGKKLSGQSRSLFDSRFQSIDGPEDEDQCGPVGFPREKFYLYVYALR